MTGTYNGWLVFLSMVVATVGSFVSLDLASRMQASRGRESQHYWALGGAISIGSSIWTQHFVGMLAFRLPIPVAYDLALTLSSWLLPVVASGFALYEVGREELGRKRLLLGGALIGAGIVGMHYTGMAAMRMQPPIHYVPAWVLVSILVALAAATASLFIAFTLRTETILSAFQRKAGSAFVLGMAIYGQHYSGMVAARFDPDSVCMAGPVQIDPIQLALVVSASSLALLILTMTISALDAYRAELSTRRARELEARVTERTAQLLDLSRRLVRLQESERRDLARELHDRVGQNLTALGINLNLLRAQPVSRDDAALARRIADSEAILDATFKTIENVTVELRPPLLEESGLPAALELFTSRFAARTGITVELAGDDGLRLRAEVELALFRVVQEALNNAARHAQAQLIQVDFQRDGEAARLTITDDGVGFDPTPSTGRTGLGLVTMRERCEAVGARFEVDARPGEGTRIIVTAGTQ